MVQRIINAQYSERTKISPADLLFGRALNLDRGIFLSQAEQDLPEPMPLGQAMSRTLRLQSALIDLHLKILKEGDQARMLNAPAERTEFAVGSYVLLEPVMGAKDRLHTRRLGPYRVLSFSGNTYTLEHLVNGKSFRVNIKRLVQFHFDANKVNPAKIAAHDLDEFEVEQILLHRGRFTNKRELQFKVRWAGYDESYDTWEPWNSLRDVDKLHDYLRLINLPNEIPKVHRQMHT